MKKQLVIMLTLCIIAVVAFSQSINVQNAFNYHKMMALDKAKQYIDLAAQNESTSKAAKTWFYKGNIYLDLHLANNMTLNLKKDMTKDEVTKVMPPVKSKKSYKFPDGKKGEQWIYDYEVRLIFDGDKLVEWNDAANGAWKPLAANALVEAYDAYQLAVKLDEAKEYIQSVKFQLYICSEQFYNVGVEKYNQKEYPKAIEYFEKVITTNSTFGIKDSLATFNAALASELSGDLTKAKKYYTNLVGMNFHNPTIFISLTGIYTKEGDTAKALKVIQDGRKVFPNNFDLLITETNIYLASGQSQKAQKLLEVAVQQQPTNANLYFAIGVNYDAIVADANKPQSERDHAFEEAVKAYTKATEFKPDYFDANYNMGALFVNKAAGQIKIANDLDLNKTKEYDELIGLATANLQKALPYLEQAHKIDPADKMTMVSLKEIYTRLNMLDKLKDINNKLGN